jgi:hypothetical protein
MPRNAANNSQKKPKERRSYIAAPVRERVLARYIAGESKRRIATTEQIDRGTVSRILSQKEIVEKLAECQSRVLDILPKAISVLKASLSSPDERIRMQAATKILEGTGVLNRGGIHQTLQIPKEASMSALGFDDFFTMGGSKAS